MQWAACWPQGNRIDSCDLEICKAHLAGFSSLLAKPSKQHKQRKFIPLSMVLNILWQSIAQDNRHLLFYLTAHSGITELTACQRLPSTRKTVTSSAEKDLWHRAGGQTAPSVTIPN